MKHIISKLSCLIALDKMRNIALPYFFLSKIHNLFFLQHALRLIAFRQIHKVLGMDPIPPPKFQRGGRFTRKRRRDNSTGEGNDSEGELDGRH